MRDIPDQIWWSLIGGIIGLIFYLIVTHLPGIPSYGTLTGAAGILFGLVWALFWARPGSPAKKIGAAKVKDKESDAPEE